MWVATATISTYQIRSHFFFYTIVQALYEGSSVNISLADGQRKLQTFVPQTSYAVAMEFDAEETRQFTTLLSHVMFGLSRETLIEESFFFGKVRDIKARFKGADGPGILFFAINARSGALPVGAWQG
jgi:hypothetical protein